MQIQLWPVSATSSLQSIWPECSLGRAFSGRPLASAAARGRKGQGASGGGSGPGPARPPTATCPSQTGSCSGSSVLRGPGSGRRGAASRALPVEPARPGAARTAPRAPHPRIRGRDPRLRPARAWRGQRDRPRQARVQRRRVELRFGPPTLTRRPKPERAEPRERSVHRREGRPGPCAVLSPPCGQTRCACAGHLSPGCHAESGRSFKFPSSGI